MVLDGTDPHQYPVLSLLRAIPVQDGIGHADPRPACGKIPVYIARIWRRRLLSAQVGDALDVAGMAYMLSVHRSFPPATGRL